jgi:hypothetical protein
MSIVNDKMSDTPETDSAIVAAGGDWSYYLGKCSRKLERERDDLQKAVNGLCEHIGVSPANTTLLAVEVLKIERERDEAIIKYTGQANEFEKQRNIALAKLEEAREAFVIATDQMVIAQCELREARERERVAITSWDEERQRALREGKRVLEERENFKSIVDKANELIARWDQPSWKDTAPTARYINALRIAVEAYERQKP